METIKTYLDNMFASIPRNEHTLRLYGDLLATMEDKYNELKAEGKTENEAVGVVISEFGNIDELLEELDIGRAEPEVEDAPYIEVHKAEAFLTTKTFCSLFVAVGVFLCILAPATFLILSDLLPSALEDFSLIGLFVLVAMAVAMFVYAGLRLEPFKYLEKKEFALSPGVEAIVRQQKQDFAPTKARLLIFGIVLIILSPTAFFLSDAMLGGIYISGSLSIAVMLLFVAIGVFLLVLAGDRDNAYNQLLQEGDYSVRKKRGKNSKVIGAVAAVWWPVITCVYLLYSFVTWNWHFSWIVWPVAGILFGAFSAAYSALHGESFLDD